MLTATWYSGEAVPRPQVRFGEPAQVQRTSLAGEFGVTQVNVHNPLPREVDVLMRVTLRQPVDCVELYGLRLPAGRALDWVIGSRAVASAFMPSEVPPGTPVRAVAFELVDWLVVGESAPEAGADMLRGAYEAWHRWPALTEDITGELRIRGSEREFATKRFEEQDVRGTFRVTPGGTVTIDAPGDLGYARMLLGMCIGNLLRHDFDEVAKRNRLVPIDGARVALIGPGWERQDHRMGTLAVQDGTPVFDACENLEVRDGVIVSSGHGNGPRTVWSSQRMGPGIAVTRRTGSNLDTAFSYREEAGRLIPTAAMQKTAYGDNLHISTELIFESFRFDAAAQTPLPQPTGDGADALRAMWDAGYRLPVAPIEISARFELVNPGTDFVWQGHKRLRGTVKMRGIGRHMQHADFEFEGELGVALQVELAAMVRDRWLMWYGRDFNDRITFDQFFGRAVIHATDERGRFAVENGPVHEVVTGNGLVRGWRGKGHTVDFTYQKFGDVQAVTRIDEQIGGSDARSQERWQSSVAVTLTKVGEHLLPTKLKFERIFGRDWGPETFVLTDIKVR